MVRAIRKVSPAIRLMRESHQVLAMDARTTTRPMMDPHLPRGERAGISADWAAVSWRRKLMWAAREMIQESIMPKKAPRRMYSKALAGAQRSSTRATTILICIAGSGIWQAREHGVHFMRSGLDFWGQEYEFPVSATASAAGMKRIVFENPRGNIKVTGGDSNDVTVTGRELINAYRREDADTGNS